MADLSDLILNQSITSSAGEIVDATGSADNSAPTFGLVTRPIGGPWEVRPVDDTGARIGSTNPMHVRGPEPRLDIARGYISGVSSVRKFGHNVAVGTANYEDVWEDGNTYPWLTASIQIRVKSGGNALDIASGSHAWSVIVSGLDSNWIQVQEQIVLSGAAVSDPTTGSFIRVNRCYVDRVGSYGQSNRGDINIETIGGVKLAEISSGSGQTQMAMYTIPSGKTGYLEAISLQTENNAACNVRIVRRENADIITGGMGSKRIITEMDNVTGHVHHEYHSLPAALPQKTDIWAQANAVTAPSAISVEFCIWFVNN